MLVQFVSNHYCNKLGNSGEKQVGMKRFPILGFMPGNTNAAFEMVDGFLNSCSDFVSRIPFVRTAGGICFLPASLAGKDLSDSRECHFH